MYNKLVSEFSSRPRDVHTVPTTKAEPKWFYVSVEKGSLYVEPARSHFPKSTVKKHSLPLKQCEDLLNFYHRRQCGEQVYQEAREYTYSQVYWYGIFSEMKL